MDYVTVVEVESLWRPMKQEEKERAEKLITVICDSLRYEAKKVGKDLDHEIMLSSELNSIAKSVVVDVVARTLMTSTHQEPMTTYSESALGYSASGTFLVPGGGLFIKRSELARLGIRKQRLSGIEM